MTSSFSFFLSLCWLTSGHRPPSNLTCPVSLNHYKKTVYIKMAASEDPGIVQDLQGSYMFMHLRELVNNEGKTNAAIWDRHQKGNRTYFANLKWPKSRLISRKIKLKIYKTLVRAVVTYKSECRTFTEYELERVRWFGENIVEFMKPQTLLV